MLYLQLPFPRRWTEPGVCFICFWHNGGGFTGLIMRHTLFKGESMPFIMELPNYHLPTVQSIAIRTWDRLKPSW